MVPRLVPALVVGEAADRQFQVIEPLDGTVEAQLQGDGEAVALLLAWARRGPPAAVVSHVLVELADAGDYSDFQAIATV